MVNCLHQGRVSAFTSGSENLHYVEQVTRGTRGQICALDNRCEECQTWDNETLLKACKHQRQLEAKRKSYSKKRSSALHSSCSSPGFLDSEVGGEVLDDSVVSSPSNMDPGPSASQLPQW
ncbi:uncharacterized protein LOC123516648 [Portunus trituberculatus]|uniref:uncharacterized protein LOC123516648 n=1 Tax=Portunus trituberculatus TaxID=210409 RepID=UPI001E1CC0FA|nr:uncharacterized protein LOC123516648 [Portunus trituberculatus]